MNSSLQMRNWVWNALKEVVLEKSYSNLYLKKNLHQVPERQQALATQIFYGTLQNYNYCQQLWKRFASKRVKPDIAVLLTMSVYQLLFLKGVKDYAIINEAVELAKKRNRSLGGFVNAVLRKVKIFVDNQEQLEFENEVQEIAIKSSLPEWLIQMWKDQYGIEKAQSFANSTVSTHPVYIRYNPLRQEKSGVEVSKGNPATKEEYRQGLYSIQDPGSYEIALWMDPQPGEKILDLCAAPGTKTFAMAEIMKNQGQIDALDIHSPRVELIAQDADRLDISIVNPMEKDATKIEDLGLYDRILCDVPCSGLGVLGRKPDMKLTLQKEDIDSLIPLQKQLLESGSAHLKDQGILVYSTCTMNKDENENQVNNFLETHPGFELIKMQTIEPDSQHDGFFMAQLRKNGE